VILLFIRHLPVTAKILYTYVCVHACARAHAHIRAFVDGGVLQLVSEFYVTQQVAVCSSPDVV
jgi:hypothetical protein